jgi:MurNAc alpha-1-phosphate uridylyltransferase
MSTEPMLPVAILAGGLATRLRPITQRIPKALVDICGEPFIRHQLRLLRANGVKRVVVCAGYLGEMVEQDVCDNPVSDIDVEFCYDGPRLLGTAGALKAARSLLGDAFFVLYGDSYLTCDFRQVQAAFVESGRAGLMTVFRNNGQWDRSNVEFADDRIVTYDKREPTERMQYIDYGLGILNESVFEQVADDEPADLAVLYSNLVKAGQLAGFEVHERFYEIGSFEGLEQTREFIASRLVPSGDRP